MLDRNVEDPNSVFTRVRVCLHAPQTVDEATSACSAGFTLRVIRHVTTVDVCLIKSNCLGTESLMVQVCSVSNRHVLMDETHSQKKGA